MAELRECPSCALDGPAEAEVCPYCGYEFPTPKPGHRPVTWAMIIAMVLFALPVLGWLLGLFG